MVGEKSTRGGTKQKSLFQFTYHVPRYQEGHATVLLIIYYYYYIFINFFFVGVEDIVFMRRQSEQVFLLFKLSNK